MNPAEIAKKLKSQIDLPSKNAKTLAMVEGIPTHKLYDVMKAYSQTGGFWFGNKAGLLTDLADEWGMNPYDLTEIAKRAFASYLLVTKDDNLAKADSEMVKMLRFGCSDEEKIKEFLQNVEKQIIK